MAYIISCIAQKGGVGKSTLAQLVAQGYAANAYSVLIADMDTKQKTSTVWGEIRASSGGGGIIYTEAVRDVKAAQKRAESHFDLLVFDGAPHATAQTLDIARVSNLILLPTGVSKFDLDPQIKLAHEMLENGIPQNRIMFVLSRIVAFPGERAEVVEYIKAAGYQVAPAYLEEKAGYRHASERGRAATETQYKSLNIKSQELFSNISAQMLRVV